MLQLIEPDKKYYIQYKEMMDEWNMEGSRIAPWPLHLKYHKEIFFEEMLTRVEEVKKGENLGEYASSTTYWLYDDESNKILGASNLRHYLTEEGLKYWGHIGYGIRPSERKKGYATELLKLTLNEAKKKNIKRVLLGAYTGNVGSWKVMEKCGGVIENIVVEDETGLPIKRYWISLKKRFADGRNKSNHILEKEYKNMRIDNEEFKGNISLLDIKKVKSPWFVDEENRCILGNNFKWLEIYPDGKNYCLTVIYDDKEKISEWYYDIARSVGEEEGVPYEDDLYLDVVIVPDGRIHLLDEDELQEAYERREISQKDYDMAYRVANELMKRYSSKEKIEKLAEFSNKYLEILKRK